MDKGSYTHYTRTLATVTIYIYSSYIIWLYIVPNVIARPDTSKCLQFSISLYSLIWTMAICYMNIYLLY